ncbi:MAG: hypothetical protein M3R65_03225 [Gemmatimonadota bacterium]|nr:hypothetical protein [Gemmatimonadota bacterium]
MTGAITAFISVRRFVSRIVILAIICALATLWFGWPFLIPIGLFYGAIDRRARARGTTAALGAALGWAIILASDAARGADIGAVASRVGAVLQAPPFVFVLLTLGFAAILCGTAAVLGSALRLDRVSFRRGGQRAEE